MSSEIRKTCVRYKVPSEILDKYKERAKKNYNLIGEVMSEDFELPYDSWRTLKGELEVNSAYNYKEKSEDVFIDCIIDIDIDGYSGFFSFVKELDDEENAEFMPIFQQKFPDFNIKPGDLRYVDYCYYNGVDEPSVFDELTKAKL